jgi:hypothetical protein
MTYTRNRTGRLGRNEQSLGSAELLPALWVLVLTTSGAAHSEDTIGRFIAQYRCPVDRLERIYAKAIPKGISMNISSSTYVMSRNTTCSVFSLLAAHCTAKPPLDFIRAKLNQCEAICLEAPFSRLSNLAFQPTIRRKTLRSNLMLVIHPISWVLPS